MYRLLRTVLLLGAVSIYGFGWAAGPTPAKRIVTLAPSLTELAYEAGAGKHLVGVSAFSDFPESAKRLPQVADYAGINIEALIALKPDLVLIWATGTRSSVIARLQELRIPAEVIHVATLADVPTAIRRIGVLAGTSDVAEVAAGKFSSRVARLSESQQGKPVVTVFFELGRTPLTTINHAHVISEVIAACGGKNVFSSAPVLVFQPAREQLLLLDPDVIIRSGTKSRESKPDDVIYDGLAAKKRGHVYAVNADHILRPGPRLADATEQVCQLLDQVRQARK